MTLISINSRGNTRRNATRAKPDFFKIVHGMLRKNIIEIVILRQKGTNSKGTISV
jgi:hypothetical protein